MLVDLFTSLDILAKLSVPELHELIIFSGTTRSLPVLSTEEAASAATTLNISNADSLMVHARLISSRPSLEVVKLWGTYLWSNDIYQALGKLKRLCKIIINIDLTYGQSYSNAK